MSARFLYHSDDEDDYVELKYFPNNQRQNMHRPYSNTEPTVMTMDRKFVKSYEKVTANQFGTLPRSRIAADAGATKATLQTIGAFSNLYSINKESNIIDEELKYLQAVECGDLKLVEKILFLYKESETGITDVEITENGTHVRKEEPALNTPSCRVETERKSRSHDELNKNGIEISEKLSLNDKKTSLPQLAHPQTRNVWPGANARSPLPVTLIQKSQSKEYLSQQDDKLLVDRIGPKHKNRFNKNCRDHWGRSALFIAMIHHNLEMLKLLLRYEVKSEECLYHAIDFRYYDIVEVIMHHDKHKPESITGELSFYQPGLTPFQLAAHKNDYVMLRILHDHGYGLRRKSKERCSMMQTRSSSGEMKENYFVLDKTWDASNHQLHYYRAISSPAYLIMMFDEGFEANSGNWDFLESIFSLYGELKKKQTDDPAVQSLYQPLADQVEEFACDLLSEVRSSRDLASLLRFDPPGQPRLTSQRNYLTPVQRAIEVRMKKFVAHENSQLAISSLRQGTLFTSEHGIRTLLTRVLLALMFPFLSVAFSVAPQSKFGSLLCNPIVNMTCHITSDLLFLLFMIVRLFLLTFYYPCDCLGTEVYPLDYIIWLWVLARIVNQLKKFRETSLGEMLRNVWTLNDLTTSFLFLIVIIIKIYNVSKYDITGAFECPAVNESLHANLRKTCTRSEWGLDEIWPITISEAAMAIIYFLIHIRAMELVYTDRTFGPLQLSLDRMFVDTIRFLFIFFVTFAGFAFAMSQLYWAWGKPESYHACNKETHNHTKIEVVQMCSQDSEPENGVCKPVYVDILHSFLEQYWTLYGYGWGREPPSAAKITCKDHNKGMTEIAGQILSMIFHAWAVVVMLNMLVAMLSHSFDRVRNNAELEWKFHRSRTWMKFIRKGVYPRPPPMNLFPSTRDLKSFRNFLKKKFSICFPDGPIRTNAQRETNQDGSHRENLQYRQALKNITHRYTRRYLLPDFRHNDLEQASPANQRKMSVTMDDMNG